MPGDFERIATDADGRAELYEQLGMDRAVEAAANVAALARAAASRFPAEQQGEHGCHA